MTRTAARCFTLSLQVVSLMTGRTGTQPKVLSTVRTNGKPLAEGLGIWSLAICRVTLNALQCWSAKVGRPIDTKESKWILSSAVLA